MGMNFYYNFSLIADCMTGVLALQQWQRHHQDNELSTIQRKAQFKAFPKTGFFSSETNPQTPSPLSGTTVVGFGRAMRS